MNITSNTSGLADLIARLNNASIEVANLLVDASDEAATLVSQALSDAAPKGSSSGTSPGDDAEGSLADSFFVIAEMQADGAVSSVRTNQGTKLGYVVNGTGIYGPRGSRIVPVQAKALYWEGAEHPYKSVAGQKPNDFVTPALAEAPNAEELLQPVIDELSALLQGGA